MTAKPRSKAGETGAIFADILVKWGDWAVNRADLALRIFVLRHRFLSVVSQFSEYRRSDHRSGDYGGWHDVCDPDRRH